LKKIGEARYNETVNVDLLWDDKAKGLRRIMALTPSGGHLPVTASFYETLEDAVLDIPKEFIGHWRIYHT